MQLRALFVVLTFFNSLLLADTPNTELLPEVKKLVDIKPINDPHMRQNAYVYLMTIDAADDDYFSVGKTIVEHSNEVVRQSLKMNNQDLINKEGDNSIYRYKTINLIDSIDGKRYRSPCFVLQNKSCLQEMINNLNKTQPLLKANKVLLTRYQDIIALPNYGSYSPMTWVSAIPKFTTVLLLSALRQTEAVDAIHQGDVQKGITIFQQEISFAKRILSSDADYLDKMVALRLLLIEYHTIERLLDHPNIQDDLNSAALARLLEPFSNKEQQALASGFEKELISGLVFFATLDYIDFFYDSFNESFSQKPFPRNYVMRMQGYDKNQTMNEVFLRAQPMINFASEPLPQAQLAYHSLIAYQQIKICRNDDIELLCMAKKWQYYGNNIAGGVLLDMAVPDYKEFLFRLYDVSNYLALIQVKLLIKQQQIPNEEIPTFLQNLGNKARNPYTLKPFTWNATRSILSTEGLSSLAEQKTDSLLVQKHFLSVPIEVDAKQH